MIRGRGVSQVGQAANPRSDVSGKNPKSGRRHSPCRAREWDRAPALPRGRPPFVTSPTPQHPPLIRSCTPRYARGCFSLRSQKPLRPFRSQTTSFQFGSSLDSSSIHRVREPFGILDQAAFTAGGFAWYGLSPRITASIRQSSRRAMAVIAFFLPRRAASFSNTAHQCGSRRTNCQAA